MKSLAIAGFISIIIIVAWLSVKLVGVAPSAFSSLASLAESVNERKNTSNQPDDVDSIKVTSNTTLINSGEPVELSWSTLDTPGSYTFRYSCLEGVAIDILNIDGIKSIACDTNYNMGNTNTLSLSVDSEKERYVDLSYKISFLRTNETSPSATGQATVTVVNSDISSLVISETGTSTDPEEIVENETESTPTTPAENIVESPAVTEVPPKKEPAYQQEFVYAIPTSDPNGKTDLSTSFINIGRITGNTFFAGSVKQDDKGAIQFEVKNYGTKTSANWTYTVSLPDGDTYTSSTQTPLKPNEQAIITVGFPTNDKSTHTFKIEVKESTDKNLLNNKFSKVVNFVK